MAHSSPLKHGPAAPWRGKSPFPSRHLGPWAGHRDRTTTPGSARPGAGRLDHLLAKAEVPGTRTWPMTLFSRWRPVVWFG